MGPSLQSSPDPQGGSGLSRGFVTSSAAAWPWDLLCSGCAEGSRTTRRLSGNQLPPPALVCGQEHHSAVSLGAPCKARGGADCPAASPAQLPAVPRPPQVHCPLVGWWVGSGGACPVGNSVACVCPLPVSSFQTAWVQSPCRPHPELPQPQLTLCVPRGLKSKSWPDLASST